MKDKILSTLLTIVLAALSSFLGNASAGRLNAADPSPIIAQAVAAGVQAGLAAHLPQPATVTAK